MKNFSQILFVALALCGVQAVNALTYTPSDLLLVFRQSGYSDVEYDIGSVTGYTGLPAGTVVPVSYDVNLVRTNFNNTLSNVTFGVVGATTSSDSSLRYWASDANLSVAPTYVTLSKFSAVRGKIQSVGDQANAITGGTNGSPLVISPAIANSYSYIVSGGSGSAISTFAGDVAFTVDAVNPATLALYEIQPSAVTPKPAATLIGTFTMQTNGNLYFVAGALPAIVSSPSSRTISSGQTTTLSVGVAGGAPAPAYQWYKNGIAIGGATNSSLTISNAYASNGGQYTVTAGNGAGSVTSSAANLAVNYSPTDLLLVFRQSGYSDVEYDIGSVSNYLGLVAGTVVPVSYDTNLVTTNFNNTLNGVRCAVVGATASTDSSLRYWASDARLSSGPTDVTLSKFSTVRGKIENIGVQLTSATGGNGTPLVISPSLANSYSFIASGGSGSAISTLGGDVAFTVDAVNPATLALYEIKPSATNPKPAATLIGRFTMQADGTVTFTAGPIPSFDVVPATLPNATYGAAYSQTFAPNLTVGPCTYAVTSGNPPLGMSLSSGGVLSGTSTVPGTNTFTVAATASDPSSGFTASRSYTLVVDKGSVYPTGNKAGTLALTTAGKSVISNLFIYGTYKHITATNNVTPKIPVPATVLYSLNGGPLQAATMTGVGSGYKSNWTAVLTAPIVGSNWFTVYAMDNQGYVTPTLSATYTYVAWTPFTLTINGSGTLAPKTLTKNAGNLPTLSGQTTNLMQPGTFNYKATGLEVGGVKYLLSNFVCTANYGFSFISNANSKFDVTFAAKTNMFMTVNFVPNRFTQCTTNSYYGLFMDSPVSFEKSGFINFAVKDGGVKTGKQVITGKVYVEGESVSFTLNPNLQGYGTSAGTARKKGGSTDVIQVSVQLDLAGGYYTTGTVHNVTAGWTTPFTAYRTPYGDPANVKLPQPLPPQATNYTMLMAGSSNPGEPGGDGYATITLWNKGVKVAGLFGDAAKIAKVPGANVSANGLWPFYMPMYLDTAKVYHGSAIGWLQFTNGVIEGGLSWIKKSGSGVGITYPNGFTNVFPITASGWTNSGLDQCFTFGVGEVTCDGGALAAIGISSFNQTWTNTSPNKAVFPKNTKTATNNLHNVSLTLTAKTGKVNGLFVDDATIKPASGQNKFSYEGAILQNQGSAFGHQKLTAGPAFPAQATTTGGATVQVKP